MIVADSPELLALASLAAVPASKMATAFNTPGEFFLHLNLEELARIQAACERLGALQTAMLEALNFYTEAAREVLEGAKDGQ